MAAFTPKDRPPEKPRSPAPDKPILGLNKAHARNNSAMTLSVDGPHGHGSEKEDKKEKKHKEGEPEEKKKDKEKKKEEKKEKRKSTMTKQQSKYGVDYLAEAAKHEEAAKELQGKLDRAQAEIETLKKDLKIKMGLTWRQLVN